MNKRFIKIAIIALAIASPISAFAEFNDPTLPAPNGNTPGSVWLSPSSQQTGLINVSSNICGGSISTPGNIYTAGDLYASSTKALRVDLANGSSVLNVSNYSSTSPAGFTMNINGNLTISQFSGTQGILTVPQICLNGDCKTAWPTGSGTIDPATWQKRVTGTCDAGQSIREIAEDGTVTCEIDSPSTDIYVNESGDTMSGSLNIVPSTVLGLRVSTTLMSGGGNTVEILGADSSGAAGLFVSGGVYGIHVTSRQDNIYSESSVPGAVGGNFYMTGASSEGVKAQGVVAGGDFYASAGNGVNATGTQIGVSGSGGTMGGYFDKNGSSSNNVYLAANGAAVDAVHSTYGVRGEGGSIGVYGISGDGYGVSGESTGGAGVYGHSDDGAGVYGYSPSASAYGVKGEGGMAGGLFADSDTPSILTRIGSSSYSIDGDGAMKIDGNTTLGGNLTVSGSTVIQGATTLSGGLNGDTSVNGSVTIKDTVQPQLTIDNNGGADSPTLRFVKDGTWAMDLMSTGGNAYLDIPASGSLYIRNGDTGGDIARFGLAGANLYVNTTLGGTLTTGYGVTVGTVLQVLNAGTQLKQVGIGGASNASYPLYNYGATWLNSSLDVNGKMTVTDQIWATYTGSGSSMVVDNTQTASDTVIKLRNGTVDKGTYQVTNAGDTYVTMPSTRSFFIANSGVDTKTTYCKIKPAASATWSCSSDRRLKKDISDLTVGLDAIMQLKPSMYTWKESGTRSAGFIAQDVQNILPSLVSTNSDDPNGYLSLSEPGMIPYMVKAIQELKVEKDAEIQELKDQNKALEARLDALEAK